MKSTLARDMDWLLRDKYAGEMTAAAIRDIARLKRGEHIAYVIGWTPFLDCKIDLYAKPLIPRPETEFWTGEVIKAVHANGKKAAANLRVLDIFCGSGCIGTAVLKQISGASVDFVDIEKKYFAGIKKSLRLNGVETRRARFIQSDVLKNIPATRYDLILANPPYIPTSGRAVAKSVLSQEPRRALFAAKDGLKFIYELIRGAKKNLNPDGSIFIEFDPPQKPAIATSAKTRGWQTEFFKDQYGRWRFVRLQQKTENKKAA